MYLLHLFLALHLTVRLSGKGNLTEKQLSLAIYLVEKQLSLAAIGERALH